MYPVLLLLLFIFSAFRFVVGCDWSGYLHQWNVQETSTFQDGFSSLEPTWWAMIHGIQYLGLPYPWLNVASSAIFFLGIHVLARRQPDPLGYLVLLFPILIINMPMSGIRQAAAIGIMCLAFSAYIDKKTVRFAGLVFFASTIHSSAIVFLLLIPLVGGNFTSKRLFLAALLAVPGSFALLGGDAAEQATRRYIESDLDAAGAVFRVGLLLLTGLAYFGFFWRKWKFVFPKDHNLVSIGALMMCALILLIPVSTVIGDRLGYYLIPIQTMIFARIPYLPLGKSRRLFSAAPYLGLALVFVVWTSLSGLFVQCYVPYQTWLFGFPEGTRFFY
ncbi:MAG: EpsG family protein [Pseudomonadota bacterium]